MYVVKIVWKTFSRHLLSMCVLRAPMSNGRFELRCRRVDNPSNAGPDGNYTTLKKQTTERTSKAIKTKHPVCVCVCCVVLCGACGGLGVQEVCEKTLGKGGWGNSKMLVNGCVVACLFFVFGDV